MALFGNKYRIDSTRLARFDYSSPGEYFVTICTKDKVCHFGDIEGAEIRLSPIGTIVEDEWKKTASVRENVALDAFVVMPNHIHGIIVIENSLVETTGSVVSRLSKATGSVVSRSSQTTGSVVSRSSQATGSVVSRSSQATGSVVSTSSETTHGLLTPGKLSAGETTHRISTLGKLSAGETTHRVVSTGNKHKTLQPNSLGSIVGQFKSVCTKRIRSAGFHDFGWQPRYYDHVVRDERDLTRIREYIAMNPSRWNTDDEFAHNIGMDPIHADD